MVSVSSQSGIQKTPETVIMTEETQRHPSDVSHRAREMAPQLSALAVLIEYLGSVPSTNRMTHNHL